MADLQVVSLGYEYEAAVSFVDLRRGHIGTSNPRISSANIQAISEIDAEVAANIAWVDLFRIAVAQVKHPDNLAIEDFGDGKPYGLPDYPIEYLRGRRIVQGDTYIAVERDGATYDFKQVPEIVAEGRLSEYTAKWLGRIVQGNYHPSFERDLSPLLPTT